MRCRERLLSRADIVPGIAVMVGLLPSRGEWPGEVDLLVDASDRRALSGGDGGPLAKAGRCGADLGAGAILVASYGIGGGDVLAGGAVRGVLTPYC